LLWKGYKLKEYAAIMGGRGIGKLYHWLRVGILHDIWQAGNNSSATNLIVEEVLGCEGRTKNAQRHRHNFLSRYGANVKHP
jgi:hypothetical protein